MKLDNLDEEFDEGFDADAKQDKAAEEVRDLIMATKELVDAFAHEHANERDDESADRDDRDDPHGRGKWDGGGVFGVDGGSQSDADGESVDRVCDALEQNGWDGELPFLLLFRLNDALDAIEDHFASDDSQKPESDKKMPRADLVNEGFA